MFRNLSNDKDDEYLSEFKQKVATQKNEFLMERGLELKRSRNGFFGTLAGIVLAGVIGLVLLKPKFADSENVEIPVIRRPVNPVKIQPSDPGGMEILNQDKSVYDLVEKKEAEPTKIESLLPTPETPKMPVIVPQAEDEPQTLTVTNNIEDLIEQVDNTAEPLPLEQESLPIKPLTETIEAVNSDLGQKINVPQKPEIDVEVKTVKEQVKVVEAQIPEEKSEVKIQNAPNGDWQVQLTASSDKSAIDRAWKNLSSKYVFLQQYSHEVESAEVNGNKVFRLKAGSFTTREDADKLCTKLKNAGGDCIVRKK